MLEVVMLAIMGRMVVLSIELRMLTVPGPWEFADGLNLVI